jgi:hypothetical protein
LFWGFRYTKFNLQKKLILNYRVNITEAMF